MKALERMVVSAAGRMTWLSEVQSMKASLPMVVTAACRKSWWRELQESTFADGGKGCSAGEIDFSEAATVAEGIYADGRQVGRGGALAKRGAIKRVVAGCSDADGKDELAEGAVHERVGRNINQVVREVEVRTGH